METSSREECDMRRLIRLTLGSLLLAALLASPHSAPVVAQSETGPEQEAPETFVPSERLPADSAISFPVDI
jgi:hypothetical protein